MPLFDIKCEECGKESEILVNKDDVKKCEYCNSEKVIVIYNRPAMLKFKGSGFYDTDYKGK